MKKGSQHQDDTRQQIARSMSGKRNAVGNEGGRPTKYQVQYSHQVYKLCLLGMTDKDLADFFEVSVRVINHWKHRYPDFHEAMRRGKMMADAEVAHALHQVACGYSHPESKFVVLRDKAGARIEEVKTTKHYPPDVKACIFWLTNRQPQHWQLRVEPSPIKPAGQLVRRDESGTIFIEPLEELNANWQRDTQRYLEHQRLSQQSQALEVSTEATQTC